ncbi:MAG: lipopolysaccharide biosynthesis protein [Pseudomonadota bacterium]
MILYGRGNIRKSLTDTIAFRAVSQISTLVGYVILVRGMPAMDFGVYSLLYAFLPVVSLVASFGLEPVLRRFQPEYLREGNTAAAGWLMRVVSSSRFVANLIVLGAILLAWNYVAPLFKLLPYRGAFAEFTLLIMLYFQASLLQAALGAHMLHRYAVGGTAALSLTKLVAYYTLSNVHGFSLEAVIFADTLAYAISYTFLRVAYHKKCVVRDGAARFRPDPAERKRLFRYALLNNFNDAGVLLLYSTLDSFFIAAFVSTTAVGIYAFYNRLKQMVSTALPVALFENVIRPLFFSIRPADADRKMPQYFSFLINMNLLLQWPALVLATVYHAEIVHTAFGGKFVEHSWMLPLVMGFAMLNTISEPTNLMAQYEEKSGIILLSKLFAIYNILAMVALVPFAGVYGAALAAGTAQLLKNWFIWWHVRRRAVWTNWRAVIGVSLPLWSLTAGICAGLRYAVAAPDIVQLLIGLTVIGSAALIHARSAAITASDRAIVTAIAPHRATRALRYFGLIARPGT